MGELAKSGILGGRKVPLEGVLALNTKPRTGKFSLECIRRAGFQNISQKIIDREVLEEEEIAALLFEAPMPVLLKLVELRFGSNLRRIEPRPMVILPLSRLLRDNGKQAVSVYASAFLRSLEYKKLRVILDHVSVEALNAGLLEVINDVANCRSGLCLAGPSVDEVSRSLRPVSLAEVNSRSYSGTKKLLLDLRQAGVDELRASTRRASLNFLVDTEFPVSLRTNLDQFSSFDLLAKELFEINQATQEGMQIDIWSPGYSGDCNLKLTPAIRDLNLLRALAVGACCLLDIPWRRASTLHLSLEAVEFARYCGANEFGYGAVDTATADFLSIAHFNTLSNVVFGSAV